MKTQFKVGDILNFRNDGSFYSVAIRFFNRIVYGIDGFTHTAIIIKTDPVTVAQALPSGFQIKEIYMPWLNNSIKSGLIEVTESKIKLKNVEEVARTYEGKPYGFGDIFSIFTILLFRGRSMGFSGSKRLICSEAVARLLYDCSGQRILLGYKKKKDKNKSEFKKRFDLITPTDVAYSRFVKWL